MIGIIGGTGLSQLFETGAISKTSFASRFGMPSDDVSFYAEAGKKVAFMPRHGHPHTVAPHLINYRANLDCLKQAGVTQIIAVNAVGGIHPSLGPAKIAVPDQIIDYTYGRQHTIYDGHKDASPGLDHIDMSFPYTALISKSLISAADTCGLQVLKSATYAATQGPRLETSAEIQRIKQDGGDMVGMTGMPEAALARELGLDYACIALSVNWAAGLVDDIITMEDINAALSVGMSDVMTIVKKTIERLE